MKVRLKGQRKMKILGKVRYIGPQINTDGLFNNGVYDVVFNPEWVDQEGALRVVDESGEDYLYHAGKPGSITNPLLYGRFEIVEDDEGFIANAIKSCEH